MKERFTISMEDDLAKWLDSMVKEGIFSSRSHAVEFCVRQLSSMSIQNVVLVRWGKEAIEPVFLTPDELKTVNKIREKHGFNTTEETIKFLVNQGLKETIKNEPPITKKPLEITTETERVE